MSRRIPLIAAVVGALLVGGATTGTTRASWVDQTSLQGAQVGSGAMAFQTAATPTSLTILKGTSGTATVAVTDTSTPAAKNLRQRITLTRTGSLPSGVTASLTTRSGVSCTATAQAAETVVPGGGVTTCLNVSAASNTAASSATVSVRITGDQMRGGTPSGWSADPRTVTVPVSILPVAPALSCGSFRYNGAYSVTWNSTPGETYTVWASFENGDYFLYDDSATSPYDAEIPMGMTVYGRVRAVNAAGVSGWSNTLRLRRTGNGSSGITCQQVSS